VPRTVKDKDKEYLYLRLAFIPSHGGCGVEQSPLFYRYSTFVACIQKTVEQFLVAESFPFL